MAGDWIKMKLAIPRRADGSIDVFKLAMRDAERVDYAIYRGSPQEIAEMVVCVADTQRQMRKRVGVAA